MTCGRPSDGQRTILIIGAGIGGLAAAVGLRRVGHRVLVVEQASRLGEVGAGIQLAPNATRALYHLGVASRLVGRAVVPQAAIRRRWEDGVVLDEVELGAQVPEKYGFPYWHVHRADLHAALLEVAMDNTGEIPGEPVRVELSKKAVGVTPGKSENSAVVAFHDGTRMTADVVVGADGIHSLTRDSIVATSAPVFSGEIAYRALIPTRLLTGSASNEWITRRPALNVWLGPQRHIVHYLVSKSEQVNLVVVAQGSEDMARESWSATANADDLVLELMGWDSRVIGLARQATAVYKWALYDHLPLPKWTQGSVCLVGDACHPMLPYLSQGAAQAIEDGVALALLLPLGGDVQEGLARYEKLRLERTAAIQAGSRANGTLYHLADGDEQRDRDEKLRESPGAIYDRVKVWGYDVLGAAKEIELASFGERRDIGTGLETEEAALVASLRGRGGGVTSKSSTRRVSFEPTDED